MNATASRVRDLATTIGLDRFEVTDIQATPAARALAFDYARGYAGDFGYMREMRSQALSGSLTAGQIKGILNCALSDAKRDAALAAAEVARVQAAAQVAAQVEAQVAAPVAPAPVVQPAGPITPKVPNGIYTVVDGTDRCTIRLDFPDWKDPSGRPFPAGKQRASYLSGSDNESAYTGFGFVTGGQVAIWSKHRADGRLGKFLNQLIKMDDPDVAGRAYALESTRCYVCNRLLTTPESVAAGIGPVCAKARHG